MAAGPLIGVLVQRHPLRRSWLVLGVVAANATGWGLVLLWPGRAPLPVLVLLVLALGLGGPGSMIGFEFARTFNPPSRLGTATGIVNVGGFVASLVTILLIGLILDARTGGHRRLRPRATSRSPWPCNIWSALIGLIGILRTRRLARRRLADDRASSSVRSARSWPKGGGLAPSAIGKELELRRDRPRTTIVKQRRT